ncbi:MAG: hypothetical protein DHS20C15_13650 [Planctomycetota bacterium]|nr:MAG: hypothetical protein DHS20C15_13650 [Planctomycetota bacterium]
MEPVEWFCARLHRDAASAPLRPRAMTSRRFARRSTFALFVALLLLATPASAEIFLTSRGNNAILVFADNATGNAAPLRKIQGNLTQITQSNSLNGIAVDALHGEIVVSVANAKILVFDIDADGNVPPLRVISGASTGLGFTAGVAVDPYYNEIWAANPSANALHVFARTANGDVAPLRTIQGGATNIAQPTGVFVDLDADEVYLTNEASSAAGVNVFARTANGNSAPLRSIVGPATSFGFATGIFRDPASGDTRAADLFTGRVLRFPEGTNGNVAPSSELSSGSLSSVAGITLTHAKEMLVVDLFRDGLRGIHVSLSGSVVPSRDLGGAQTQIDTPIYVATTSGPFPGAVFTSAPNASFSYSLAGTNPLSYSVSGAPHLGTPLGFTLDVGSTGGTSGMIIASFEVGHLPLSSGNVLLVDFPPIRLLGPRNGALLDFQLALPLDLSLAGLKVFTQGVHFSSAPGYVLSNAVNLELGL